MTYDCQKLSLDQVLDGYKMVSKLYPHIPSLSMWRAWEYAAYKLVTLREPVLDVGCGDGKFFQLLFPSIKNVIGIDLDPGVVQRAKDSQVYRRVYNESADNLQNLYGTVNSVFANCSIEHMDNLDKVLFNINQCLAPGGEFLFSVVTDKFIKWNNLPNLSRLLGNSAQAKQIEENFLSFHSLKNAFAIAEWQQIIKEAGFDLTLSIPIVPELTGKLFLFIDSLWHINTGDGEFGSDIHRYLAGLNSFPESFGQIYNGILNAEQNFDVGCGAVFYARKTGAR